jgi:hypothetical protein
MASSSSSGGANRGATSSSSSSASELFVDDFVNRMFTWASMPRPRHTKQNVPRTYDGILQPWALKKDERDVKTNLTAIAVTPIEIEPSFKLPIGT